MEDGISLKGVSGNGGIVYYFIDHYIYFQFWLSYRNYRISFAPV